MMEIILYSGFWFIVGAVCSLLTADIIKMAQRIKELKNNDRPN